MRLRRLAPLVVLAVLLVSAFVSGQQRTVTADKFQAKLGPWTDVAAYGARCDGTTDDTVAVRLAFLAKGNPTFGAPLTGLTSTGGGEVRFPKGVCIITDVVYYTSGMRIVGEGYGSEILFEPTGSNKALFAPSTTKADGHSVYDVQFRDLMIWGWSQYAQDGIVLDDVMFFRVENVSVASFGRYGIYVGETSGTAGAYYNEIRQPYLLNNGTNLYIDNGANAVHVYGGRIKQTGAYGWDGHTPLPTPDYLVVVKSIGASFNGVSFEGAPSVALVHDQGAGTAFTNCYQENLAYGPFALRDASVNGYGALHVSGLSGPPAWVKYEHFDQVAESPSWIVTAPDALGLGTPTFVPAFINGSFDKGVYNWYIPYSHATVTRDTTTVFQSNASLKIDHAGDSVWTCDGSTPPVCGWDPSVTPEWVGQAIDLTNYQGKTVWITALLYAATADDLASVGPYGMSVWIGRNRFLSPVIDYGNGWQLWATSINVTTTSASFQLKQYATVAHRTVYLGSVQLWVGGHPAQPMQQPESYHATAAPTTGTWATGDIVVNTAPGPAAAIQWECTAGGSPGTWIAVDPVLRQDATPGTAQTGHVNLTGTIRGSQLFAHDPATDTLIISDAAGANWPHLRLSRSGSVLWDLYSPSDNALHFYDSADRLVLQSNGLLPASTDVMYLGYLNKKWLTLYADELRVETLVAQNTIATIGGRILVGPTNLLVADVGPSDTAIHVKYNDINVGDLLYLEANGNVEYMVASSAGSGSAGDFTIPVTRDLDGTGANMWYSGDAVFNTGQAGNGFIDLYSTRGTKAATEQGPSIVGNVRLSSTFNDWAPRWALGNLRGLYDYGTSANTYGFAAGDPAAAWIAADATNGVRIMSGATPKITLSPAGNASFTGSVTAASGAIGGWAIGATTISATSGSNSVVMDAGNGRIVWDNGSFMKVTGTGFGTSSQFIEWFGPHQASVADCEESNAVMYLKVDGSAYFGGTLLVGQLVNSTTGTVLDDTNLADLGPFSSLGKTITISASYEFHGATTFAATSGGLTSYNGTTKQSPSVSLILSRSINGGAFSDVMTVNVTNGNHLEEPPIAGEEPGFYQQNMGTSFTYLDPDQLAQDRHYKLRLASWTNVNSTVTKNLLTLVSIEVK